MRPELGKDPLLGGPHRLKRQRRQVGIKIGKKLRDLRKIWKFSEGRSRLLEQVWYWTLWPNVNRVWMKTRIQIGALNLKGNCLKLDRIWELDSDRRFSFVIRTRLHVFKTWDVTAPDLWPCFGADQGSVARLAWYRGYPSPRIPTALCCSII
jgi:hypothetical protein